MLLVPFLTFVFSGDLLFPPLLAPLRPSCSLNWSGGISGPVPCELIYNNTLLLPNASLSLLCAFICDEGAAVGP